MQRNVKERPNNGRRSTFRRRQRNHTHSHESTGSLSSSLIIIHRPRSRHDWAWRVRRNRRHRPMQDCPARRWLGRRRDMSLRLLRLVRHRRCGRRARRRGPLRRRSIHHLRRPILRRVPAADLRRMCSARSPVRIRVRTCASCCSCITGRGIVSVHRA